MTAGQEDSTHWSRHEWDLINVTELFEHKPAIMKKAEGYLETLRSALAAELKAHPELYPANTDLVKGQIARGENHEGFPFLSLDLPQKFSKTEFFAFRTLFWWGHYLGFSLILKGPDLPTQVNRLKERRQSLAGADVYLSRHSNPWEWDRVHFTKLSQLSGNDVQQVIEGIQYVKLMRFFLVSEESFPELNWAEAGLQSFRDLVQLVLE